MEAPVHLIKPSDPREQEVRDKYAAAEEQFCVCGIATRHHKTDDPNKWLGCEVAKQRQHGPRNPERWNDARPDVTCAVRAALITACGPSMEYHCATYTHDELLALSLAIASAAIKTYRDGGK
jgi:hypothetical protein